MRKHYRQEQLLAPGGYFDWCENDFVGRTKITETAGIRDIETYLLNRLTALQQADIVEKIEVFRIQTIYSTHSDEFFTMSQAVATQLAQVFRHYQQRGHVWGQLVLENCMRSNEHLLHVISEAKSLGMFTGIALDEDAHVEAPNASIVRECLIMNPSVKVLTIYVNSDEVFQATRDCLKTIPAGKASETNTRLTDLNILCNENYSDQLKVLTEGLRLNDSLKSLRMISNFEEYIYADEADLVELINALPRTLERFQLGDFLVTAPVQAAIVDWLAHPECRLRELCLGEDRAGLSPYHYNFYDTLNYESLAWALKRNNSLEKFELWNYQCSSAKLLELLNALPECPLLTTICIRQAKLSLLDFRPGSISRSSTLQNLELSQIRFSDFPCNGTYQETNTKNSNQTRQSMIELLRAIPSIGSLGEITETIWLDSPCHSSEATFLLGFNRIARGHLTSQVSKAVPLNLWVKLFDKLDVGAQTCETRKSWDSTKQSRMNRKLLMRCKASVLFSLLRNHAPELDLSVTFATS